MSRTICIVFLALLSSCMLRPTYHRPCVDTPDSWRVEADTCDATNMLWWEQFNDPILNGLIVTALEENLDLKVAVARVYEYYYRLGVAQSQLFPQVYGNGGATRQEASLATFPLIDPRFRYTNQYNLFGTLTYEADIWGRIQSGADVAMAELLSKTQARRAVVLTLVKSVATSYLLLRQYDKQLVISVETVASREESLKLARYRFEEGMTSEIEVKQAEAEVQSAIISVKQLEISIAQTENLISVLIGKNPQPIIRGRTLDQLTMPFDVPAGIPSDILQNRPDVLEAEELLAASTSAIGVAKANFFPQISLTGLFGNESAELHRLLTSPAQTWQYGGTFLQPIFTGGLLVSQLGIAEAQHDEALYTYLSTILKAFQEVDDALIAHKKTLELVQVQKKQVEVLKDYLHLAHLQYDEGETDYLNVLDAERSLFDAQLNYAQAQSESFITLVDLYAALGGGWVVDADDKAIDISF